MRAGKGDNFMHPSLLPLNLMLSTFPKVQEASFGRPISAQMQYFRQSSLSNAGSFCMTDTSCFCSASAKAVCFAYCMGQAIGFTQEKEEMTIMQLDPAICLLSGSHGGELPASTTAVGSRSSPTAATNLAEPPSKT